ncbi:pyroglutamylated RF-amide peptide receptor isoform X2 [Canis lupus baileyi]|nr:pyroglutamylated RF-amide peptide receptor isoform X2 [Canis lupus dingo]XP_038420691.1 pyroglutamylated RF-amide peptide receptor isoform X1 [Canis lupus familiaris]XP_540966.4 pyroglutamylated RF-amide peptide receptor isoform X1 [Canis lupus familiaris]|eukprot:XP_540966.4 pyroglutamylated RFamide peptide receptor [Canis lupus familiaris]
MQSLNVTPEQLSRLLRGHNLSREQFIARYGLRPLVYTPELPGRAKLALVLTGVLLFALALFGNALVVYVVTRRRAMRTVTNIFICSLALSDLLIAFFCIPVTMLQNISDTWLGGAFICKMLPFVQSTAVVTEILTMTCIAAERHQGLVHPFKMKGQYTNRRAFTMLGVVWLVAVIVGSPMWHVQRLEIKYDFLYEKEHICCLEEWASPAHQKIYTTFILVILFLLPLMLMLILYSKIGYELWIKKRVGDCSVLRTIHGKEMSKITRKKKRAVIMMVTVVALFAVCWAPFHVVHMMMEYSNFEKEYDDVTIKMIFAIVQIIGFSNSICNPIVYAFMNENFKKNFLSAVCYCIVKETLSPARRHGNSGITMMQKKAIFSRRENPVEETKGEAFSDGNIEVKLCEQPEGKKYLK